MSRTRGAGWTLRNLLEVNQYRPLVWPIRVPNRFQAECLLCGERVYVAQGALRRDVIGRGGRNRESCTHIRRHLVNAPQDGGEPQPRPDKEPEVREILARHRYTPIGPYPGAMSRGWAARCQMCAAELYVVPARLMYRPIRTICRHDKRLLIKAAPARLLRAEEVTEMQRRERS